MHQQFVNPTRERLKGLLHGTMGLAAALYIVLALCGYLYAYEDTKVCARIFGAWMRSVEINMFAPGAYSLQMRPLCFLQPDRMFV